MLTISVFSWKNLSMNIYFWGLFIQLIYCLDLVYLAIFKKKHQSMYKFIFTILISFFLVNYSFSQSFQFHRISSAVVIGDTVFGAVTKGVLKNTSASTQSFKYVRVINNLPVGWESSMCGAGNCFGSEVDTIPPFATHQLFQLQPGASDTLSIDVYGSTPGFGTIVIHTFITTNPTNVIADTFKVQLVPHVGISENNQTVNNYKLYQNYPNPFNQVSVISYQLSVRGNVKLIVYDLAGKEILTLVDENKIPGYYKVKFDGGNLASGVYFYSMYVNGVKNETKKMILIK